jgi:hypothetical protein
VLLQVLYYCCYYTTIIYLIFCYAHNLFQLVPDQVDATGHVKVYVAPVPRTASESDVTLLFSNSFCIHINFCIYRFCLYVYISQCCQLVVIVCCSA